MFLRGLGRGFVPYWLKILIERARSSLKDKLTISAIVQMFLNVMRHGRREFPL